MRLNRWLVAAAISVLASLGLTEAAWGWKVNMNINAVLDGPQEEDPGGYVAFNYDDDNINGEPDWDEHPVLGEDALVALWLYREPDDEVGTITLDASPRANVRVWTTSTKGALVTLPKTWDRSEGEDLPVLLWVEGVVTSGAERDVTLTLTWDGDGVPDDVEPDTVRITVFDLDLDTDTNNDGTIHAGDDGEDQFEELAPGRIVCLNRDGDGPDLDDLAEIKFTFLPLTINKGNITLRATSGGSRITVWTSTSKTTEVDLPKTWNLATASLPSSLYVDGTDLGDVALQLEYQPPLGTYKNADDAALHVTDTISWCPDANDYDEEAFAVSWEPNAYPPGAPGWLGHETTDAVLNGVKDQGYNVTVCRYQDTSPVTPNDPDPDEDIGSCTRGNFNGACPGAVLHVMAHGSVGFFCGVFRNSEERIEDWIAGEPGTHMVAVDSDWGWYAKVYSQWLKDNWKPVLDQNKAIVVFLPCRNAEGGSSSTLDACGGRVRFGNEGAIATNLTGAELATLFGRMNGTQDGGTKRTAGKAYGDGSDYEYIVMHGNGDNTHKWTTLCPAPNAVFPTAAPGNRKGAGCIIFDTYMNDNISADEAVTKAAGAMPVSTRRWFGNDTAKYGVSFDFDKRGGGAATMRANADKCRSCENHTAGGRYMDGNRVAPNGDKKEWSF